MEFLIDESSASCIQDILNLCHHINRNMEEAEKVTHLMKGVAEKLYQALLPIEIDTVDEFCRHCRRIEALNKKRIGRPQFERLANVSLISADSDIDIEALIQRVVKKEINNVVAGRNYPVSTENMEEEVFLRTEETIALILKC
ncbi:ASPRV1 [Cordylochernes scorpioides]|uniref:ASPRV1 n=1 Tax=Cordylochernes scorpioides TaxID=51811 RepID=A0ABY6KQ20_9ARAC|nr:ASPRV1 [Cordylochernes scorpioides]